MEYLAWQVDLRLGYVSLPHSPALEHMHLSIPHPLSASRWHDRIARLLRKHHLPEGVRGNRRGFPLAGVAGAQRPAGEDAH